MTSKSTPGPWQVIKYDAVTSWIETKNRSPICLIAVRLMEGKTEANAQLIASAPELLEACKLAAKYVAKMVADDIQTAMPPQTALDRIEQAITNATKEVER